MRSRAELTVADGKVRCTGHWIASDLTHIETQLAAVDWPDTAIEFDLAQVKKIDTAGAWLLHRARTKLEDSGTAVTISGAGKQVEDLLELVAEYGDASGDRPRPYVPGFLEGVGRNTHGQLSQYAEYLNFLGQTTLATARSIRRPKRIRLSLLIGEIETSGLNALPIVGLLSFLMGVVIAYQGGIVLRDYGASIYIADIVGLATVRELAPLITAIIVAGRTGSAYTAQIGTMMVTEEVDALRSIGIPPIEMLVLPKLFALIITLPLLTVFGDILGLFGGMIMASTMLDLNATTYISRLASALTLESYLSGIGKAPVFAGIIATVGCFQGFRVRGSAESVGRQTTISVVQSIFLVLIVDAAFSVAFSKLGI